MIVRFAKALLNLVYPLTCCACDEKMAGNTGICDPCASKVDKNLAGVAACRYDGVLKKALQTFKYKNGLALVDTFSRFLIEFIERNFDMKNIDAIIPMPLHPVKLRQRGFNQSQLLAVPISKRYGVPISTSALKKVRYTPPQSGLDRTSRLRNPANAFRVKKNTPLKGKSVLLLDDVYTTGATIKSAVDALRSAGISQIRVLTLARGI